MPSLNECKFIGNLGRDPETRFTQDGKAVCSFSVACSESWNDKNTGEKKEHTEWVNISAFGKLAEIMDKYLSKGSKVYISGKMKTDKYTDKNGVEKYSTKIVAKDMIMLDSRDAATDGTAPHQNHQNTPQPPQSAPVGSAPAGADDFSDEIPFFSYEYKSIV